MIRRYRFIVSTDDGERLITGLDEARHWLDQDCLVYQVTQLERFSGVDLCIEEREAYEASRKHWP